MYSESSEQVVQLLLDHGYNADPDAVKYLSNLDNPQAATYEIIESVPDDTLILTPDIVKQALDDSPENQTSPHQSSNPHPSVSTADEHIDNSNKVSGQSKESPDETEGIPSSSGSSSRNSGRSLERQNVDIRGDVTGESIGTGEYDDFVKLFRDRYEKLSNQLRNRVNHRPTDSVEKMSGGSDAALIGMINDVRSTSNGHWLIELEDPHGTFPCLIMKDRDIAGVVDELLLDEVIAVEGTLSDDSGILFVDSVRFPDIPRTYTPSTADRHVQAALISDVHVGSVDFVEDAWNRFTSWLHEPEAESIEYLLIAGDMVEGVGVYPGQDEELEIVDIYKQYEQFSEHLKEVPGDIEIIMIPGNHDAVRLAEPQPGFDQELRDIMGVHDARISGNPSTVTIEGVSVLMYHGVSLDELIAELPDDKATYEDPHLPMHQLLKKRHLAPQYGGHMRLAPEPEDYLVIDEIPDIFHTGHVHKRGFGKYHGVLAINSGCWQSQTEFQKSVDLDPDVAGVPVVDLDTLNVTVHTF